MWVAQVRRLIHWIFPIGLTLAFDAGSWGREFGAVFCYTVYVNGDI